MPIQALAARDSSRLLGDGDAVDPLNRATLIAALPKNLKTLECCGRVLGAQPLDACSHDRSLTPARWMQGVAHQQKERGQGEPEPEPEPEAGRRLPV